MWLDEEIYDKNTREKIRERISGKVDLQLGKKGISNSFLKEVKSRLEKQGVVKIRILKSFIKSTELNRREVARRIAESSGAELVDMRGYTFILARVKVKNKSNVKK